MTPSGGARSGSYLTSALKGFQGEADGTTDAHSCSSPKAEGDLTGVGADRPHRDAAAGLYLAWIRDLDPILGRDVGWWRALGIMVFVAERWPVELQFRCGTHSFSLTDVP